MHGITVSLIARCCTRWITWMIHWHTQMTSTHRLWWVNNLKTRDGHRLTMEKQATVRKCIVGRQWGGGILNNILGGTWDVRRSVHIFWYWSMRSPVHCSSRYLGMKSPIYYSYKYWCVTMMMPPTLFSCGYWAIRLPVHYSFRYWAIMPPVLCISSKLV